ncbi:MAG: hypothetical protein P8X91_08555 [Candidatus Bathyarchaeota archaeon]
MINGVEVHRPLIAVSKPPISSIRPIPLACRPVHNRPLEIFSALVAMSIVTTLIFPPVLSRGIKRNPGLMDAKVDRKY